MASTYYPDVVTDDLLKQLERRIAKEYRAAATECYQDAQDYFVKFADRYKKEYAAYKKGAYTKQEFDNWVMTQVARGKGWTQLADELADRCCQANRVAAAYINDSTPGIYSLNYNFEAYAIDQAYNNSLSFHAYDEQTVRRLMMQDEIKLPRINPNYASDFLWNKKKMNSALISNILQGKDIYQLAGSFMVVTNMNHNAAVRNARTAYTGAQNAGRQASYLQAEQMGIEIKKEWIATLDTRTRTSHQHLDGERVDNFAKFSNGLMYPGDMSGHPSELYNCRCTMRAIMPGINDSRDTSRRGRESEPWIDENGRMQQGNNTIFKGTTYTGIDGTMSYKDWLKFKNDNKDNNNNDDNNKKAKNNRLKSLLASSGNILAIAEGKAYTPSEQMGKIINLLKQNNVEYLGVKKHINPLTEEEIIKRIGGGDMTAGSCVSVGLAYCGQKSGFDVLDYRGGKSWDWFSEKINIMEISKLSGLNTIESTAKSPLTAGNQLLKQIQKGEPNIEYFLVAGDHASIVKADEAGKLHYLELQKEDCGWRKFDGNARYTLATRFKCKGTNQGAFLNKAFAIKVDDFSQCDDFENLLGYINTNNGNQKKGAQGYAK